MATSQSETLRFTYPRVLRRTLPVNPAAEINRQSAGSGETRKIGSNQSTSKANRRWQWGSFQAVLRSAPIPEAVRNVRGWTYEPIGHRYDQA